MASEPTVVIHFKDVPSSEKVREAMEDRCAHLTSEFEEATRFEISFSPHGTDVEAHGHATGKNTNVATQATGKNLRAAGDQVLEKIERQLRKNHDKRIFSQRRDAQRHPPKRDATE